MDLSFILIIGVSAILTSTLMVYAEVASRRRLSVFRLSFGISYLLGLLLAQPWHIASAEDAGISVMMLIFIAMWVAVGCFIGAVPTALMLSIFKWAAGLISRRS